MEPSIIPEQSVKSVRFAHSILFTISVAALLLSLSSAQDSRYSRATKEINALCNVDFDRIQFDRALTDRRIRDHFDKINEILSQFNIQYLLKIREDERSPDVSCHVDRDPSSGPLIQEIYDFLTQGSYIEVSFPVIDTAMEPLLRDFLENNRAKIPQWGNRLSIASKENDLELRFWFTGKNLNPVTSTSIRFPKAIRHDEIRIPINYLEEIDKYPEWRLLVKRQNGRLMFLPFVRSVWDEIRTENLVHARSILARKDNPKETALTVFGLSIPQSLISLAVPIIVCFVSFYFYLNLQHLGLVLVTNPDWKLFPWVGLMRGPLASIITFVSTVALPLGKKIAG